MTMIRRWRVVVILFVLVTSVSNVYAANQEQLILDADEKLRFAGVVGLCHPTTNAFSPIFPLCSFTNKERATSPSPASTALKKGKSSAIKHRYARTTVFTGAESSEDHDEMTTVPNNSEASDTVREEGHFEITTSGSAAGSTTEAEGKKEIIDDNAVIVTTENAAGTTTNTAGSTEFNDDNVGITTENASEINTAAGGTEGNEENVDVAVNEKESGITERIDDNVDFTTTGNESDTPGNKQDHDEIGVEEEKEDHQEDQWFYIKNGIMAFTCVLIAAIAAGLTMGMMSLDPLVLMIKMRAGSSDEEKNQAEKLLPLVKQHHRLLVTLLLLNSIANEALPLFLDELVPGYIAVILSVTLVLFFGEIIPSAVFTGPNQMKIASHLVPMVNVVMCLLAPLAFPIAKILDHVLHEDDAHGTGYNRGEISALVRIQYEERMAAKKRQKNEREQARRNLSIHHGSVPDLEIPPLKDYELRKGVNAAKKLLGGQELDSIDISSQPSPLSVRRLRDSVRFRQNMTGLQLSTRSYQSHHESERSGISDLRSNFHRLPSIHFDEVNMVEGALTMGTKTVMDVYTPLRKVFAIPYDTILNEKNVVKLYSSGYSRVPVFDRNHQKDNDITAIRGILMTKQLIVLSPRDKRPVSTLPLYKPFCLSPKMPLVEVINLLQTGGRGNRGGHLALVCARPKTAEASLENNEPLPEIAGLMGIVTLEDVIEAILQEDIIDETDKLERGQIKLARRAFRKWKVYAQRKKIRREEQELQAANRDPDILGVPIVERAVAANDVVNSRSLASAEEGTLENGSSAIGLDDSIPSEETVLLNRAGTDQSTRELGFLGMLSYER